MMLSRSLAGTLLTYEDGKLTGLPKQYGTATFDLKTTTLRLGDRELAIPTHLRRLFIGDPQVTDLDKSQPEQEVIQPFEYFFLTSTYPDGDVNETDRYIEIQIKAGPNSTYGLVVNIDEMTLTRASVYHIKVGFIPLALSPPDETETASD